MCCTGLGCVGLGYIVLCCVRMVMLDCIACIVLCCVGLSWFCHACWIGLCCVALGCVVLCWIVLCWIGLPVLCCAVLCCILLDWTGFTGLWFSITKFALRLTLRGKCWRFFWPLPSQSGFFFFLKIFFSFFFDADHLKGLCWICHSTVSIPCFGFWLWGMWDPSSLTGNQACTSCSGRWSLNYWTTRGFPGRPKWCSEAGRQEHER